MIVSKKLKRDAKVPYLQCVQKDKEGTYSIWNLPSNGDKSKAILVNKGFNYEDIKHNL